MTRTRTATWVPMPSWLRVAVFDDVVAVRGEEFRIPGMICDVYPHADDVAGLCRAERYDWVFMDFAMGAGHKTGTEAIVALRAAGFVGRICATSSDPLANVAMKAAGAEESLLKKALLRSYLVHIGAQHLAATGGGAAQPG